MLLLHTHTYTYMYMFEILVINNSKLHITMEKHDLQHFNFINTYKHYWKYNNLKKIQF